MGERKRGSALGMCCRASSQAHTPLCGAHTFPTPASMAIATYRCVCLLLQYLLQQVAQSYNGIGALYHSLGQYERALEYYQKYLDITIKISGQESPDVAKSYSCIGVVYRSLGQHEQALKYHQKGKYYQKGSSTIRKA